MRKYINALKKIIQDFLKLIIATIITVGIIGLTFFLIGSTVKSCNNSIHEMINSDN
ncbi:hypothetical protein [Flavobacterium psychrophilum]|uniref:hypothetical protein n=1 Tax=Flavobacterium psychrophilum TaxID=96345 RepID=UPI00141BC5B0|nr:hypothetical protein [Flavobacterium psychrophilum]